jgi:hypothetical protein
MRNTIQLLVAVVAVVSAACSIDVRGEGAVVREEKRFTVSGDPELNLRTFDGSVQLKSWDRKEVLVEIERRGPDNDTAKALVVNTTQDGNRIAVDAPAPSSKRDLIQIGSSQSPSVSLIVTAPKNMIADVLTGDGSISADDLVGAVVLNSGDGSIRARHVEGSLRVRTGDGSIAITDGVGQVEANSGDGSVELGGRFDAVDVRTGDGSVRVEVLAGSSLKKDWSIDTGDGSITLRLPSALDAEIDAHTGDGGVTASGFSGLAERREEERDTLRTQVGKGGRTLRLRSGDGSINISR